jgi:amino acid transporter
MIQVSLITGGGVINFVVMCVTYIFWWNALKAQGFDRNKLPYKGWFQPYSAYIGLVWMIFIVFVYGYAAFKPWSLDDFWINYTMLILAFVTFTGWKLFKRTKFVKPHELDLIWEAPAIDAYEATFYEKPLGFWREMGQLIGIKRGATGDKRRGSVN